MSPGPQANLEVERYIGSYLISQRIPPNVKSSTGTGASKRYQNNHVKPKNTDNDKARNFNKFCYPHQNAGPGRYSMAPSPGPGPGPGQLPLPVDYNCHYGKGWTGVPLISMTSGNHRRNKKTFSATNSSQQHKYSQKQGQQNGYVKNKETEDNPFSESNRSPLTRLAIHTQGAPLIQAGRYGGGGGGGSRCRNTFVRDQTPRAYRGEGARWEAAKEAKSSSISTTKDQPCGNADNSSVASDESSGNSENSLPRIIKPRKRRKKDRKPITGATTTAGTSSTGTANESPHYTREAEQNVESAVFQSLLPLCFESTTSTSTAPSVNSSEQNLNDLITESCQASTTEEKQSEDLIDPLTSADEFPLGNLLDDEEDDQSELSSSAPASLCQCRYCDPSGVIWDVDQRCYSPFLTPPSPSMFSKSLPLTFNSVTRSYSRQMSVVDPQYPQLSFDGDLGSLLRRSWSAPSYHSPDRPSTTTPGSGATHTPSVGLQVSSEIVTSPNGHRDIEIKFYSSSSPPESSSSSSKGQSSAGASACGSVGAGASASELELELGLSDVHLHFPVEE